MANFIKTLESKTGIDWGVIISGMILLALTTLVIVLINPLFIFKDGKREGILPEDTSPKISTNISKQEIDNTKPTIAQDLKSEELVFDHYNNLLSRVAIYPNGFNTPPGLIQNCQDEKNNREKCNQEVIKLTQTISVEPKVVEAYLYAKVAVSRGGQPFSGLTKYDSIYFFLDDSSKYGGHLLRSKAVWSRENVDSTELLFDLDGLSFTDIPYKDAVTPIKTPNLLDVLNEGGNHYIVSFVSTLGAGRIQEMKISYRGGEIILKR